MFKGANNISLIFLPRTILIAYVDIQRQNYIDVASQTWCSALSANVEFLDTTKEMWDTLNRVFGTYACTASPFHAIILAMQKLGNLLDQYQSMMTDTATQRCYRQEFYRKVAIFLLYGVTTVGDDSTTHFIDL
ncbi:unnamed protein product [Spirodela intermedia]|uniref:Uncharacterized protein n=1 Tax=Spirodela intermedia TaxID=51605 RepID=A0A7I8JAD0_SPIIN|nr:unnamed protein product [Spirodela intermedia]CAA6666951.1 unnamed protein product [Spirodela intermedia]